MTLVFIIAILQQVMPSAPSKRRRQKLMLQLTDATVELTEHVLTAQ
jgi:hypothetical protein